MNEETKKPEGNNYSHLIVISVVILFVVIGIILYELLWRGEGGGESGEENDTSIAWLAIFIPVIVATSRGRKKAASGKEKKILAGITIVLVILVVLTVLVWALQ